MYGILNFGDQLLQKPAFQPFMTGSNRYRSDNMVGKSPLPCYCTGLSSVKLFH